MSVTICLLAFMDRRAICLRFISATPNQKSKLDLLEGSCITVGLRDRFGGANVGPEYFELVFGG